ncbi:30S ribosomal protein S6 [Aerophototrophica crusticola]|uniref:Small ribosomal subunit protein bS6 n=1 Tax=Aerophototrophica crusticola TaxID=1709002 RepID=A0A858R5R9_9PROT|nr:30S ribosomal protein S6 [Rhodospirillaceae bacterium B3]
MALYETILIARQDIASSQVEGLTETFSNILKENGGSVVKTEQWGLKTLAYRINKNRKGHYVYLGIDAPAAAVAEMERNMSISEDVLRFMTVKVEKIDEAQTAMLANKGERNERGPRGGFGDRGPRRDFGDRGPRREFGDRPRRDAEPRSEGEGDRA